MTSGVVYLPCRVIKRCSAIQRSVYGEPLTNVRRSAHEGEYKERCDENCGQLHRHGNMRPHENQAKLFILTLDLSAGDDADEFDAVAFG